MADQQVHSKKTLLKLRAQEENNRRLREQLVDEQDFNKLIIERVVLNMIFMSIKEISDLRLSKTFRIDGIITTTGAPFEPSVCTELDTLDAVGIYELTKLGKFHQHVRLLNTRLVNEVKCKSSTLSYKNLRLIVQGYNDAGKEEILIQSPTIQWVSQRIIFSLPRE